MFSFQRQACYVRESVPKSLVVFNHLGNMHSFQRQACYVRESVLKSLFVFNLLFRKFVFLQCGGTEKAQRAFLLANLQFFKLTNIHFGGLTVARKRNEQTVVFNLFFRKYVLPFCGTLDTCAKAYREVCRIQHFIQETRFPLPGQKENFSLFQPPI